MLNRNRTQGSLTTSTECSEKKIMDQVIMEEGGGRGVRLCHVCPAFADLKQTFKFIPLSNIQHLNGTLQISGKISLKVVNQVQLIKPFIQINN